MLALLLAVALIGATVLAMLLGGVAIAFGAGVLALNACLLVLAMRRRPARVGPDPRALPERWRPSSFTRLPQAPADPEAEPAPTLTVHRL